MAEGEHNGRIAAAAVLAIAVPFVAVQEGTVLFTYADIVNVPTICMGHTGPDVKMGQRYTTEQCKAILDKDLLDHALRLDACIHKPLSANQAASVLSWGFNVGTGAACSSTLVRMINAGRPAAEWCEQLPRWNRAKGMVLYGLVKRRAAEKALCLKPAPEVASTRNNGPQKVA